MLFCKLAHSIFKQTLNMPYFRKFIINTMKKFSIWFLHHLDNLQPNHCRRVHNFAIANDRKGDSVLILSNISLEKIREKICQQLPEAILMEWYPLLYNLVKLIHLSHANALKSNKKTKQNTGTDLSLMKIPMAQTQLPETLTLNSMI